MTSFPAPTHMPGRIQFITLVSAIMMIVAFAIDAMLPAMPAIGHGLGVSDPADWQLVMSAFLLGFGIAQLFVGLMADAWGRRGLMLWGIFGFAVTSLAATLAPTFEHLLIARFFQGVTAATAQVVVRSVVRDRFEGRDMAQVMSLASSIFMMAPILAPAMGQLLLTFGPWRWIFGALALIGAAVWLWVVIRLPETLARENRIPITVNEIITSVKEVVSDRMSLGYTLANTAMTCGVFAFLMSVQRIFAETLGRADMLPTGFAIMAAGMAVASLGNAAIVRRFGMRKIGHTALFWFTAVAGIHLAVAFSGHESMTTFIALQLAMMLGFSFVVGNFGAMAMENMGRVAGMANSVQGAFSSVTGTVIGTLIGRAFDGTTVPLYAAFFGCGLVAIAIVYVTERGRFFVAHYAYPMPERE